MDSKMEKNLANLITATQKVEEQLKSGGGGIGLNIVVYRQLVIQAYFPENYFSKFQGIF